MTQADCTNDSAQSNWTQNQQIEDINCTFNWNLFNIFEKKILMIEKYVNWKFTFKFNKIKLNGKFKSEEILATEITDM